MTRRQPAAFGDLLVRLRESRAMTQDELAAALDVHVASVSRWERGLSMPGIDRLGPLCRVLRVSPSVFVDLPRRGLERYFVD